MCCACFGRRETFENDTAAAETSIRGVGIDVEAMVSAPAECLQCVVDCCWQLANFFFMILETFSGSESMDY